jgi:Transglutaminase-like superfamily
VYNVPNLGSRMLRFAWVRTFRELAWRDRLLLLEAAFFLTGAASAIALLPFNCVGSLASRPVTRPEPPPQTCLQKIKSVRWAITACARRVPRHAKCFQQGLAAQFMLRRRGISSVLHYGAAPDPQLGLVAHVWVRADNVDVIGGEIASRFALLTTFPDQNGSTPVLQGSGL